MFTVPAGRSVSRNELDGFTSRSVSPAAADSNDVSQALQARLSSAIELDFVDVATPAVATSDQGPAQDAEKVEDETFAFKLFAAAPVPKASDATSLATPGAARDPDATVQPSNSNGANTVQYISLKDEPIHYPLPTRPLSYYIAPPASALASARFVSAALSTADVLRLSKVPRPGLACPWRIINTPAVHARSLRASLASSQHRSASSSPERSTSATGLVGIVGSERRKRLGKKSRIKARNVLAARKAEEREKLAERERKEELVREKKTRMNRAKQARKREKAKMKGDGMRGGGGGGDEGEGSVNE